MTALDKLKKAKELLARSSIEDAARDAEMIIAHCLMTDRATLYRDNPKIPQNLITNIDRLVKRRAGREPLQYILGYVEFFGLKIKVGQGVLIPRPETELLVEEAVKIIRNNLLLPPHPPLTKGGQRGGGVSKRVRFLDLCTGSGCLALVLAQEISDIQVYGTDTSETAIQYAKENAKLNRIKNVTFMKGSLFEPVIGLTFDLIVSNPPYIRSKDIKYLQPEIKDWESHDALDGGEDGLDYYRLMIPVVRNYLRQGGYLVLEIGIEQGDAVKKLAEEAGLIDIKLVKDYANIDRICIAKNNILVKNKAQ